MWMTSVCVMSFMSSMVLREWMCDMSSMMLAEDPLALLVPEVLRE